MLSLPNIQVLIDENKLDEAREALSSILSTSPHNDEAWLKMGLLEMRFQNYGEAVSCFKKALAINPRSEAATPLELAQDILEFFNPDLLNP